MSVSRLPTAILGLAGLWAFLAGTSGCSSATITPSPGQMRIFASTTVGDHFHMVVIDQTDVQAPPVLGIKVTTTASSEHAHTVGISDTELMMVFAGSPVKVTTSVSNAGGPHAHDITIKRWF